MWTPADQNALPTAEDMTNAMKTISTLEHELAEAELRVEMLKKDLSKIKAWASPVRRLTFDALTAIFEWCGDIDWRSPVKIAAVCNLWRRAVLSTPRAWSFVELQSDMSDSGIRMFFERSGQRKLHLYFRRIRPFSLLLPVLHRIQCINIEPPSYVPTDVIFPEVNHVIVNGAWYPLISTDQFPALSHLETSWSPLINSPPSHSTSAFPSLQSWTLYLADDPTTLRCLRTCQNTLVSLKLIHSDTVMFSDQRPVILPVLKYLQIFTEDGAAEWTIELITPKLEVYDVYVKGEEDQDYSIHMDVGTVIKLRSNQRPPLPSLFRLQNLQLYMDGIESFVSVLEEIAADKGICPDLRTIEVLKDATRDTKDVWKILNDANISRDRQIALKYVKEFTPFPEHVPDNCGEDMSCSRYQVNLY